MIIFIEYIYIMHALRASKQSLNKYMPPPPEIHGPIDSALTPVLASPTHCIGGRRCDSQCPLKHIPHHSASCYHDTAPVYGPCWFPHVGSNLIIVMLYKGVVETLPKSMQHSHDFNGRSETNRHVTSHNVTLHRFLAGYIIIFMTDMIAKEGYGK